MKLVLLSDTHTFHSKVVVPEGDILIFAGDMGMTGSLAEVVKFADWFSLHPHQYKIAIAGNHDWAFQKIPEAAVAALTTRGIRYLQDTGTVINGALFFGSPQTPWFMDWAFNVQRGSDIKKYWDKIPYHTDVLITHGPPYGVLDQSAPHLATDHLGCEELSLAVKRVNPRLHVFGHIHGGYGKVDLVDTTFVNAALVNEAYAPGRTPWVVDL